MRHLIDPLDFTLEETNDILTLQTESVKTVLLIHILQMAKSWLPCFMSQVPVPGCPSNLLC